MQVGLYLLVLDPLEALQIRHGWLRNYVLLGGLCELGVNQFQRRDRREREENYFTSSYSLHGLEKRPCGPLGFDIIAREFLCQPGKASRDFSVALLHQRHAAVNGS
jgi:hypothetical protein